MAFTKEFKEVAVQTAFADLDRNFRDPSHDYSSCDPTPKYDHTKYLAGTQKQGLFESIYHDGLKVPIWLAELTGDERKAASDKAGRDILYRVIRGHRRLVTVEKINAIYPGHIVLIPAIVHSGLARDEEWALMADHGGVNKEEDLSELGQYRACINLQGTGAFSQERIGQMLGETRGWAMRRIWIHKMSVSTPIETEFLKRFDKEKNPDGSYFTFTYKDVEDLHKAFTEDEKNKRNPMDDGAAFLSLWNTHAATGSAKPTEPKALTRQKIDERTPFIAGRAALEEYARFATGRGGNAGDAAKMYDVLAEKASKSDTLATDLDKAKARIVTLESELSSAMETVAALTAEITVLKAEKTKPVQPVHQSGQSRKGNR